MHLPDEMHAIFLAKIFSRNQHELDILKTISLFKFANYSQIVSKVLLKRNY